MVGGGVIEAGELLMGPTRGGVHRRSWRQRGRLPVAAIVPARAGQHRRRRRRRRPGPADLRHGRAEQRSGVPLRVVLVQHPQPAGRPRRAGGGASGPRAGRGDRAGGAAPAAAGGPKTRRRSPSRSGWSSPPAACRRWATCPDQPAGRACTDTWCVRFPLTPGRHMRGAASPTARSPASRFVVAGSHLSTDPAERPAQAARSSGRWPRRTHPVVAGADLNEGPDGPAWRRWRTGWSTPRRRRTGRTGSPSPAPTRAGASTRSSSTRGSGSSTTTWWTRRRPGGPATTSRSWWTCCCRHR